MLARDEDLPDLHLLEQLIAELELLDLPSWARSPPKIRKSAGGLMAWTSLAARTVFSTKRVLSDLGIEMRVGDPGELERRLGAERDVHGVDQRPPGEGLGDRGGPGQARSMKEGAPGDLELRIGTHPRLLQHRSYFTPFALELRHGLPPWILDLEC